MSYDASIKAIDNNTSLFLLDILYLVGVVSGSLIGIQANYICYRIFKGKEYN